MENKSLTLTILKITLLAFIAILLSAILIILLVRPDGKLNLFKFSSKSKLVHDEEITEKIDNIIVSTKSADIEIEENETDIIKVKFYGDEDNKISVDKTNNTLNISDDSNNFCIGFCNYATQKLIISIPKSTLTKLELKTASGDINVPINLTNVNLKTISGDINLFQAINAKVETTSGDMKITEVEYLNAKTISGEVEVGFIKKQCDIKTTSGDIDLDVINLLENSKITTISGDVEIDKNQNSYIKTETISGEVEVRNNNRYADSELTIKTTSGDIEVED